MKVIIDGIEYIPKKKKKNTIKKSYEIGQILNWKGFEWYVIGIEGNQIKLMLKNVLDEEHLKKYSDGDEWWINEKCVRMSNDVKPPFDFEKSYIKNVILENMKKDLGTDCEITLPSKEEIEKLPDELKECDEWYWTRTTYENSNYATAWYVYRYGCVTNDNTSTSVIGARAVVILDNKYLKGETK